MKVKVNDQYQFDVEVKNDQLEVNGIKIDMDLKEISQTSSHLIYKCKSYNVEVVSENKLGKTAVIKVNGTAYHIQTEDKYDQLLKQLGMDNAQFAKVKEIKAPMPGLVLNVLVTEGTEVAKGDNLLILEAMKMENIIKSPSDGVVKKILVNKGDKAEKNEILIQFN